MLKTWSPAHSGITLGGGALWEDVRSLRDALEEATENLGSPFSLSLAPGSPGMLSFFCVLSHEPPPPHPCRPKATELSNSLLKPMNPPAKINLSSLMLVTSDVLSQHQNVNKGPSLDREKTGVERVVCLRSKKRCLRQCCRFIGPSRLSSSPHLRYHLRLVKF